MRASRTVVHGVNGAKDDEKKRNGVREQSRISTRGQEDKWSSGAELEG